MGKIKSFTAGTLCGALLVSAAAFAQSNLKIFVNGSEIDASQSYISGDRTYIPLRAVAEALGAQVQWNGDDYSISITSKSIINARLSENGILKNPSENSEEFELILEAVANSWNDNILSNSYYDKLDGSAKTAVEQILSYKYEFANIPPALNNAFKSYWTEEMLQTDLYNKLTAVFDIKQEKDGFCLTVK